MGIENQHNNGHLSNSPQKIKRHVKNGQSASSNDSFPAAITQIKINRAYNRTPIDTN